MIQRISLIAYVRSDPEKQVPAMLGDFRVYAYAIREATNL